MTKSEFEPIDEQSELSEARIMWASDFFGEWLLPLIRENRIANPDSIKELRNRFLVDPPQIGSDFTISDVLVAAERWQAAYREKYSTIDVDKLPNGKSFIRAIKLLKAALNESWTQNSFLDG